MYPNKPGVPQNSNDAPYYGAEVPIQQQSYASPVPHVVTQPHMTHGDALPPHQLAQQPQFYDGTFGSRSPYGLLINGPQPAYSINPYAAAYIASPYAARPQTIGPGIYTGNPGSTFLYHGPEVNDYDDRAKRRVAEDEASNWNTKQRKLHELTTDKTILEARRIVIILILHILNEKEKVEAWNAMKKSSLKPLAVSLEKCLYSKAFTFQEYCDISTLKQRVLDLATEVKELYGS